MKTILFFNNNSHFSHMKETYESTRNMSLSSFIKEQIWLTLKLCFILLISYLSLIKDKNKNNFQNLKNQKNYWICYLCSIETMKEEKWIHYYIVVIYVHKNPRAELFIMMTQVIYEYFFILLSISLSKNFKGTFLKN